LKVEPTDTELTKSLKDLIRGDLSRHYMDNEVVNLLDVTSVLDARFKVKYVKQVDDVLARVREEGASIVRQNQEQQAQQCTETQASAVTPEPP